MKTPSALRPRFGPLLLVSGLTFVSAWAQPATPPSTPPAARADRGAAAAPGDRLVVYKKTAGQDLRLWVRSPSDLKPADRRPAVVFFHGGGWVGGPLFQFNDQSRHFVARGMVAVQVEYRFPAKSENDAPPVVCIQDARSALRWVRAHAVELGIDPARIAAAGGSAGGHLAAFASMVEGVDDPQDDLKVSPRGNAQLLFNPVLDNGPGGYGHARMGERWRDYSPAHHVTADDPPAIVFLGTKDALVSTATIESFAVAMKKVGVRCETRFYADKEHGFFNKSPDKETTVAACDAFLVSLGWLPAQSPAAPAVNAP